MISEINILIIQCSPVNVEKSVDFQLVTERLFVTAPAVSSKQALCLSSESMSGFGSDASSSY